jgi:hypothetical protein
MESKIALRLYRVPDREEAQVKRLSDGVLRMIAPNRNGNLREEIEPEIRAAKKCRVIRIDDLFEVDR